MFAPNRHNGNKDGKRFPPDAPFVNIKTSEKRYEKTYDNYSRSCRTRCWRMQHKVGQDNGIPQRDHGCV